MNKENVKDYLPFIQALAEGKTIQHSPDDGRWDDAENLSFCLEPKYYRIKPEPRTFVIYINKHTHQICHQNQSDSNWERITVQEVLK